MACANVREFTTLHLPEGVDSTFRSSYFTFKYSRRSIPIKVFEYKAFSDSMIESGYIDSTLMIGLISPHSSLVARGHTNKMVFGTDSIKFTIEYSTIGMYIESEQYSLLGEIIFNPEKNVPGYDKYKKDISPRKVVLIGSVDSVYNNDSVKFYFEMGVAKKLLDSLNINGFLMIGRDSFYVQPLYNSIPLHGKNVKPMQVLQGISLIKEGKVHAFLQHAPLVKGTFKGGLKDQLFLNPKSIAIEQMLVSAYFSLVSRTLQSESNGLIF